MDLCSFFIFSKAINTWFLMVKIVIKGSTEQWEEIFYNNMYHFLFF